jgi:hypothetical protein
LQLTVTPVCELPAQIWVVPTPHSPGGFVQSGQGSLPVYGEHVLVLVKQYCVAIWHCDVPQKNVPVPHALCCAPPESCGVLPESCDDDVAASVSSVVPPPLELELLHA